MNTTGVTNRMKTVVHLRRMRFVGHVARMGVKKSEGKRSLGRPGRRLEDNKIDFQESGGKMWTGFIFLRIGTSDGLCERGSVSWGALEQCFSQPS